MNSLKKNYNWVEKLWTDFIEQNPQYIIKETPLSYFFCDNEYDANECAKLVVNRIKKASATSLWWYEQNKEELPIVGDLHIITDWDGNAKAIIEITKIELVQYNRITAEFAKQKGEGDKSLAYWKKVHQAYYTREMKLFNAKFEQDMVIVCEYFKTIYLK